jgi:hypothetical protein
VQHTTLPHNKATYLRNKSQNKLLFVHQGTETRDNRHTAPGATYGYDPRASVPIAGVVPGVDLVTHTQSVPYGGSGSILCADKIIYKRDVIAKWQMPNGP